MNQARVDKLNALLAQDPEDAFVRYALAMEFSSAGNFEQASSLLLDLLQRDPSYVPAYQQLGALYRSEGKTAQAANMLRTGILRARASGDQHAAGEMQDELDDLVV